MTAPGRRALFLLCIAALSRCGGETDALAPGASDAGADTVTSDVVAFDSVASDAADVSPPADAWTDPQQCADYDCFCAGLAACEAVQWERDVSRGRIGERVCGVHENRCVTTYYAAMGYGTFLRCEFPLGTSCDIDGGYNVGAANCVPMGECSLSSPPPSDAWPDANCTDLLSSSCE